MKQIVLPDFQFTGDYYWEVVADLIRFIRTRIPNLDESDEEPLMELLYAFGLTHQKEAVLLDLIAREGFLPTCKLAESLAAHLQLIDVALLQMTPAEVEVLCALTAYLSAASTLVIPDKAVFSVPSSEVAANPFERTGAITVTDTTHMTAYYDRGGVETDLTTDINDPASNFRPFPNPVAVGDLFYIGHPEVMFDQLKVAFTAPSIGAIGGVWEYYEAELSQSYPDAPAVQVIAGPPEHLRLTLNGLLGTADRTGSIVHVRCLPTGASEDCVSLFGGGDNYILTTGILGQTLPSTVITDYRVGVRWKELQLTADSILTWDGAIGYKEMDFVLPVDAQKTWVPDPVKLKYWIRFRVLTGGGSVPPFCRLFKFYEGKQYILFDATQGRTYSEIFVSDGTPSQRFLISRYPVTEGSLVVEIDDTGIGLIYETWTKVDSFFNSMSTDKHFRIEWSSTGEPTFIVGDGTNGRIPVLNALVKGTFRTIAGGVDGNVATDCITEKTTGCAYIGDVTNPKAASGWNDREGSTPESIELLKIEGPRRLRSMGRILNAEDLVTAAKDFVDSVGAEPIERASVIEGAWGPNSAELTIVGTAGASLSSAQLTEVDDYFNGDPTIGTYGKMPLNQKVVSANYIPHNIDITITVYGLSNATAIQTDLERMLQPTAKTDDGGYLWNFSGVVASTWIASRAYDADPAAYNVVVALPAGDVALGIRELPVLGTLTIIPG